MYKYASETKVPKPGNLSGPISSPSEWNLSLLQLQPVMSPPSGSLLGKQTQQLPGLEKNAHYFNCWPTHQPDKFTAMPTTHHESSELLMKTAFRIKVWQGMGIVFHGEQCLWHSLGKKGKFSGLKKVILWIISFVPTSIMTVLKWQEDLITVVNLFIYLFVLFCLF